MYDIQKAENDIARTGKNNTRNTLFSHILRHLFSDLQSDEFSWRSFDFLWRKKLKNVFTDVEAEKEIN